ncbi:MAG TPA: hypothetical protein VFL82_17090, partial [Thermomicrobiales bacterium]|nr:hypothetical protein [Thermomicrobiales bacterium]
MTAHPSPSPRTRWGTARRWLPVLLWMAVIFFLSSRQKLPQPHGISPDLQAIAGHFTVYAVLAFLIFLALGDRG